MNSERGGGASRRPTGLSYNLRGIENVSGDQFDMEFNAEDVKYKTVQSHTGNKEKLSNSQVCCLAQLYLAAA